jgi:hypothetical protein
MEMLPCVDVGFTSRLSVGVGITSAHPGVEPSWAVAVKKLVAHLCCRWRLDQKAARLHTEGGKPSVMR